MHAEGEGREGPERWHSTLLLRRFKLGFLLLPSGTEREGGSLCSGRVWWWCESRMRVKPKAERG
jgi:hypothetical protein